MDIAEICYELYKADWLKRNIENNSISVVDFLTEFADNSGGVYTIADYLDERGFNGALYACFGEFLENEYCETDYMVSLLQDSRCDDDVIEEYLNDTEDTEE